MDQQVRDQLSAVIPEFELDAKLELIAEINELKREKNALILGHNYMEPAVFHGVADVTGDSLELCFKAQQAKEDTLVFCGVEFMAETAKIINPSKRVLLPAQKAGCSLASSITAEDVRRLKSMYPGVPVVTYINTYADVKAETDICCTSGNAEKIVASLDSDKVIFIPDEYLARNVAKATGKHIIFPSLEEQSPKSQTEGFEKAFISWPGKCEVHDLFKPSDIDSVREQYPDVKVLAHPECPPDVVDASDFSGSTSAMIRYVKEHEKKRYLLLTECSMADNIIASNPKSELLRLCSHRCPHMAQITLEDTKRCLELGQYEVQVETKLAAKAKASIDAMLRLSK